MLYRNPVIPGFHPDPSVCRVGGDYYLVTSSFQFFPGVPIFHSRDLVHWRLLGHCLTRRSQLELSGAACSGGIWAPTIRYHAPEGLFYMITTNVSDKGNFYVTARDPAGEWSDPVWVEEGNFDPSLFFDDDGRVYYTRRGGTGIDQAEIDIRTGRLMAAPREISKGLCSPDIEGPHLYKINGLYYLMAAEGGTRFGHSETVCRGASPWGPFEPCPHNPILTHRHLSGGPIRATGHGELIQAHDGNWWLFFLATRHHDYDAQSHLGRETFLAPVSWTADGWPVVNGGLAIRAEMEGDLPPAHPWPAEPARDDFDRPFLGPHWVYLRNPDPDEYDLRERPGFLRLRGSAATLDERGSPAFVGRRQEHLRCRAAARLEFDPADGNEEAGLAVYLDAAHHYELAVAGGSGGRRVIVRRRVEDLSVIAACETVGPGPLTLHLAAGAERYEFSYAQAQEPPRTIATAVTKLLGSELAGGWTGVFLGLYATGNGKPSAAPAYFDWFEYEGDDA
ncbi:MAG: glycoside hydrolase family 43 protein [Patescibacteria group bacterium]